MSPAGTGIEALAVLAARFRHADLGLRCVFPTAILTTLADRGDEDAQLVLRRLPQVVAGGLLHPDFPAAVHIQPQQKIPIVFSDASGMRLARDSFAKGSAASVATALFDGFIRTGPAKAEQIVSPVAAIGRGVNIFMFVTQFAAHAAVTPHTTRSAEDTSPSAELTQSLPNHS